MELWRELELDGDRTLVQVTGGIDYRTRRGAGHIASMLASQTVSHRLLTAAEAKERWRGVRFDGAVLFHPHADTVDADLAVRTSMEYARRRGATVLADTRVLRVEVIDERQALVVTNRGDVRGGRVVVAAGGWANQLLDDLESMPDLTVTQQKVFHFPRKETTVDWPVIIHQGELDTYSLLGGREGGPMGGRKVAESVGTTTSADGRSAIVDPVARERITDYVRKNLPGLVPEPFNETTCPYTSTDNGDFTLDRVGPLVVCSPCSGHGAKFTPLVGELVVDLATRAATIPLRFTLAAHAATSTQVSH